ncbi:integrase core domain-containing protein [Pedobacter suwonensis]|uniref:integrase core domain-containing protein n=1 Tax=Pedobacter suwonensis TaxID=332999 RepID=UPI0016444401|nr:integrase core domain-containing protein [Pedobacter suwonensis]
MTINREAITIKAAYTIPAVRVIQILERTTHEQPLRKNIPDAYLFNDTNQVQVLADEWMEDYNYSEPHEALEGITSSRYKHKVMNYYEIKMKSSFYTVPAILGFGDFMFNIRITSWEILATIIVISLIIYFLTRKRK